MRKYLCFTDTLKLPGRMKGAALMHLVKYVFVSGIVSDMHEELPETEGVEYLG